MSLDGEQEVLGLDADDQPTELTLKSNDGQEYKLPESYTSISDLITASRTGESVMELELPQVKGKTLSLVIEYLNHHKGEQGQLLEMPLRSARMMDVCEDAWDARFIDRVADMGNASLYEMVIAANYLGIKCLLHLSAARVAAKIKGLPISKLKETLSIPSPEDTADAEVGEEEQEDTVMKTESAPVVG